MTKFQWSPKMSVGLAALDDDHKQLVHIINQLEGGGEDTDNGVLQQSLKALQRYAQFHFAREESVMRACGYGAFEHHRDAHGDFIQEVQELSAQVAGATGKKAEKLRAELLAYLQDWLVHHILVEDMAYRPTLEENIKAATKAADDFQPSHVWWSD